MTQNSRLPIKAAVKIIVDSPCDLPTAWLKRLDVTVIPAFVIFGTESFADDSIELPRADFYRRLAAAKELPGTASPPAAVAEQLMRDALEKAEQVVVFTVAAQFSSLYNSIRLAAEHVDAQRVTVVDSGTVSMAEGWQAFAAAEAAAKGASRDEVIAIASSVRGRARLLAAIDTLEYLRRGGRVSWAIANIGALLQIKPILDVRNSTVETVARVRTMGKAVQTLVQMAHDAAPLEYLAILHTSNPTGAEQLRAQLADVLPTTEIMIGEATPALGTHVGPGCVGLAYVTKS